MEWKKGVQLMEDHYQFSYQGNQRHAKNRAQKQATQKKTKYAAGPQGTRALLIIDGAYFQQGSEKYLRDKFGVNLFETSRPDVLMMNFVDTIEEGLQVQGIERHYITSLLEKNNGNQSLIDSQNTYIDSLKNECSFEIDGRDFKNMSVYCPNRNGTNSSRPIMRKVQAEVDVAIATKILSMAFRDEYDLLIAVTGDRDFKDGFNAVFNDSGKPVKIGGFQGSLWHEYYDNSFGWEALEAEELWDKAIGKFLSFNLKEKSEKAENHKHEIQACNDEKSHSFKNQDYQNQNGYNTSYNNYKNRQHSMYSRQRNNYVQSFKPLKRGKGKGKANRHAKSRQRDFKESGDIIDSVNQPCGKMLRSANKQMDQLFVLNNSHAFKGQYFDIGAEETKINLIADLHVDDFMAELALFITDGNVEASKEFLKRK